MATLLQAIASQDHAEIQRLINSGQHPLSRIEMCVEMRGHAVSTILPYVPPDCAHHLRKIIRHLEFTGRYPAAKKELEDWLSNVELQRD